MKKAEGKKGRFEKALGKFETVIDNSFINYCSDLFIVAMVVLWIADSVYESLIASAVTISSIILSFQTGTGCYEVSMWSSIGTNIAVPLGAGGAVWMIKNGVQHAIANNRGERAHMDFPKVNAEGDGEGKEELFNNGNDPDETGQPIHGQEGAVG